MYSHLVEKMRQQILFSSVCGRCTYRCTVERQIFMVQHFHVFRGSTFKLENLAHENRRDIYRNRENCFREILQIANPQKFCTLKIWRSTVHLYVHLPHTEDYIHVHDCTYICIYNVMHICCIQVPTDDCSVQDLL